MFISETNSALGKPIPIVHRTRNHSSQTSGEVAEGGAPAAREAAGAACCMELGMLCTDAAPPCMLSNGDGSICELSM